jgi:signal transduction histidine kinase
MTVEGANGGEVDALRRALEAERKSRERLEAVQAVTDVALAYLELEELLQALLIRTRDILHVDTCAILLLDEDHNELVARAAVGIEEEVEAGVRIPVGGGFAGRIAAERRPVILPVVDHAHVLNPILLEKGIKSMMGVPLMAHDAIVGVMHVGTLHPHEFVQDDVELLVLVAQRAALAIEKARVHQEMLRLDQMKLNFVAIASHELRTPATSVYGLLTTLRARGHELPEDVRVELEDTAWQQSDRLRRLIEQLLDLSRLDARAIEVQPQPLVLGRTLSDMVQGDDVIVEVDPSLAVVADPLVIERVVSNLVANARQHGAPPVRIDAEQKDRHLRISVADCGDGIPEALVPRLFERFEHGGGTGTGLGLAIAKAYANAHGGDLYYEPTQKGARFDLVIPARETGSSYQNVGVTTSRQLGAEDGTARAGEEAGVDQQRHHHRVGDRLAVEALDREPLGASALHVGDEGGERDAQPLLLRLTQRNERAAAALDEERRLAAEQDDVRAGDARRPSACALRPRQRRAVRLRRIGGGEHERLRLAAFARPQLAQPLHRPAERELGAAEALDEVAAPARPERLERTQLLVDGAVAAGDALAADAVACDDALPLEQELRQRAPVEVAGEERRGERPTPLRRRHGGCARAGEAPSVRLL